MNLHDVPMALKVAEPGEGLASLLSAPMHVSLPSTAPTQQITTTAGAIQVATLVAITDTGATPLVEIGGKAVCARSIVDLHGAHIGKSVVLMYEGGDPSLPIVMGVLRDTAEGSLENQPGQVQVDTDGERLIVSAKEQLVFRCGKASITLTKAGKVLIEGTYLLTQSTGVNRIKGGSIQLN